MLPSKDLHTHCMKCKQALSDDERLCPNCGADREIELAIARDLHPTIAGLRRWLIVVAALLLFYAGLLWEHVGASPLVYGLVVVVIVFGVCAAVVERAPLVVACIAAGAFFAQWASEIAVAGMWALTPGAPLAVRIISAAILVDGVRFGIKARLIRKRMMQGVPKATATFRDGS